MRLLILSTPAGAFQTDQAAAAAAAAAAFLQLLRLLPTHMEQWQLTRMWLLQVQPWIL